MFDYHRADFLEIDFTVTDRSRVIGDRGRIEREDLIAKILIKVDHFSNHFVSSQVELGVYEYFFL